MKIFFILLLLLYSLFAKNLLWYHSYEKAFEKSIEMKKPLMLFITMKGCHACDKMKEDVFTDKEVRDFLEKHFVLLELDLKKNKIPKKFTSYMTPTYEFIDANGDRIVDTVYGSKSKERFLKLLKSATKL